VIKSKTVQHIINVEKYQMKVMLRTQVTNYNKNLFQKIIEYPIQGVW